jgi:undecaprenyl diphosphate synthase
MATTGGIEMNAAVPAPRHVAIIMDGNGRWAASRGLPRTAGHKAGVDALRRAVRAAADLGIEYLTIYSFSSENWTRPVGEVTYLFDLLRRFIRQDVAELHAAGVRIKIIGERDRLDPDLVSLLTETEKLTAENTQLTLIVAFNYGSRQEIIRAARSLVESARRGELDPDEVTPELFASRLYTTDVPDPDLLIRTSGEHRLSNYLLWQSAYTEFVFVDELWPDFTKDVLQRAIAIYQKRDRRFGGLKVQSA